MSKEQIEVVVATYDNPHSMCREAWVNGKIRASISLALLSTKGFNGFAEMHMGLNNIGPWDEGRIIGDSSAIPQSERDY